MMDIEVREDVRPRRDGDRGGKGAGRGGRDRNRGRDGKHRDRRPPDGKFHDHVASMEPAAVTDAPAPQAEAPRTEQQPRPEKPRHEQRPRQEQRPRGEQPAAREKRERGNQRHHNEQAAKPEAVDKSQLPAFLFRPVPVKKPEPQPE
jgi:hypothetical protein